MIGKVCLVTGANRGLGKAMAGALAKEGATVVMACRDQARGETARLDIVGQTGNQNVAAMVLDLSDQASTRKFVRDFDVRYDRLDVLLHIAAVYMVQRTLTPDGLETMFATNHLGPFLLTGLLLGKLKASAPARVLIVTAPSSSALNFEDLQGEKNFRSLQAFGASKMANLLFNYQLSDRLEGSGVTVNAVHPGLMKTDLMREAPLPIRALANLAARSPEKAASDLVYLAFSPDVAWMAGRFFAGKKGIESNKYSHDQNMQNRLWDISVRLTQQRY